ncbi:MAG: zinc ribbon domain-containing protein, partial [Clostridiales bacterium]|nr:zinc ribbon domain-containing protein [Clostridiales bacterium]
RCGSVYEGAQCPNCGEMAHKFCLACGAAVNADAGFCVKCGYKFLDVKESSTVYDSKNDNADDNAKSTVAQIAVAESSEQCGTVYGANLAGSRKVTAKVYNVLRYVPMALFVLFSVLLFAFYSASLIDVEIVYMNGIIEHRSFGSLYTMIYEFTGISITLIIFGFIALAYSVLLLILFFNMRFKRKEIKIFGIFKMTVGEVAAITTVVWYLIFVILSGIVMGQVADLNNGIGVAVNYEYNALFTSGAASKLIMAFAIIFMVFAIAAVAVRYILARKFPALYQAETEERKKTATGVEARQINVAPSGKHPNTPEYAKTSKSMEDGARPLLYFAYLNAKLRRAVFAFFLCTFISFVVLSLLAAFSLLLSPHWLIVTCAGITIAVVIVSMVKTPLWTPEKFLSAVKKKHFNHKAKLGLKKVLFVLLPILVFLLIGIIYYINYSSRVYTGVISYIAPRFRGYIMAAVYIIISLIIYVVAKIAIAMQSGRIAEYLYGCPAPEPNSKLRIEYDEKREIELYNAYMIARVHGKVKNDEAVEKKIAWRGILLKTMCIAFVATTATCTLVTPTFVDKFSASYVSACAGYHYIGYLFGTPNQVENDAYGNPIYIYYDEDIVTGSEFSILYYYGGDDFKVVLNTKGSFNNTASQKKAVKSVSFRWGIEYNSKGYIDTDNGGFYAEIFYVDGSYKYEFVPIAAFTPIDFDKKGTQTVSWSDEWGTYTATVKYCGDYD